ncbi:DUF1972 domain-containing protein [Phycicoccus sp. Root101]|uniref:DUF1972 domain-containing protein n=1 Tax=Phycicoccus sp. Root101 TaxID=1736421 RepID=UPI000703468B|nr:DUF1972 domain-containing protein [Phycicoccus sp. Root101]KQU67663.1 glycosyl transferase [Phycicoccus sp. Root101]
MHIAMIGTRGVPARYGGFETCIEEVGQRLAERGHSVVVYCRGSRDEIPRHYLGMRTVVLPALRHRTLETLSHSGLSVAHAVIREDIDVALVFNAANSPFLPVLRAKGIPVATHVDGLEWQRAKWGGAGRHYYRRAEGWAVRWSDALIADAQGIADYYATTHRTGTRLITYGAPTPVDAPHRLDELGLRPKQYHLVVARFEPENHVAEIVEGYVGSTARMPLVVVGSAPYSAAYTQRIHHLADGRVRLLGGLWDQELLDQLYSGAFIYWHGHSVGGTNPSLLRAIGAGAPCSTFDVSFNREVVGTSGRFWTSSKDVTALLEESEADPGPVAERGMLALEEAARYDWDEVTDRYEQLCLDLAGAQHRGASSRKLSFRKAVDHA